MDGFGDNFVPNGESNAVDPAAEFLAREQDVLAGLDDAPITVAETDTVAVASNGEVMAAVDETADFSFSPPDDAFAVPESGTAVEATSLEAVPREGNTGDYTFESSDDALAGTSAEMPASAIQHTPERVITPIPRVDPEAIRIWREDHQQKLIEKDAAEEKAKYALREKAQQELTDWYKQHDEQVAKTRQTNRCAEKELVADTERPEPGTEWERISKLCDFNPKTAKSSRDVSRMRSIILHVKQSPPLKA